MLLALQESNHLPSQLAIELTSPPPENGTSLSQSLGLHDPAVWTDDVKHLAQLYSDNFDNTSDEEAEPSPRNPMGLIEWLRRNQPSVFTAETAAMADPKKTVADKALAGSGSGAMGSPGVMGNNAEKTPSKKKKAAGEPGSASSSRSKKRKAVQEEGSDATTAQDAQAENLAAASKPVKRVKKEE